MTLFQYINCLCYELFMLLFKLQIRRIANGELLGMVLQIEEVLHHCDITIILEFEQQYTEQAEEEPDTKKGRKLSRTDRRKSLSPTRAKSRMSISAGAGASRMSSNETPSSDKQALDGEQQARPLSYFNEPIDSLLLIRKFLLTWRRLAILQEEWGKRKLGVEKIDSPSQFREYK